MKTQAWGWLAAAVLAAGLNASYHDGGLQWAHQAVDQMRHNTSAVLALATGHADQFLAEARLASARPQLSACPLALLAEARTTVMPEEFNLRRVEMISARQQAELARLEAHRARMEAELARIHIPAVAFNPVVVQAPKVSFCRRVRVNVPRIPARMPAIPVVRIENSGFGSL